MSTTKSIGPFAALGMLFGGLGKAINVANTALGTAETAVEETDKLLQKGYEAVNISIEGGMEDLRTDYIIEDAERRVRKAKAIAKANVIIAQLETDGIEG